jgi:zinc protease
MKRYASCAGFVVGVFSLFASLAPAAELPAGIEQAATVEGITEYRLSNGMRVLLYPDPASSRVTVNMTVLVGSRHEGYGETGMAHLLEHMLFKGTPGHPNVPKALADRGANFNGTTWVDRTNYFETLNASDENLEFAIRLEADRLVNSYVKREDLVSEMTVVRNEFERGENSPPNILSQRMMAVAYEWHNYGKSTIGNRSDIERVPIEKLQAFYRKYYQPDNVVLVVAGNFKPEKALEFVAKYFGKLKKPTRSLDATYTEEPAQDGERSVTLRRVGTVGAVGAVYHIPAAAHEDFAALEVLASILSAQPSGRLHQKLVKTKLATSVSARAEGWHDPGVLEVSVTPEKGQTEAVRDATIDLLEKVGDDVITGAEVDRAKASFASSRDQLMKDANRIGITLSDWAAKGDWRLFFLHRDRIAKVTTNDVRRVAAKYLTRSNRTVGVYLPTDKAQRADVPETPDVAKLVKDYKGSEAVAGGEFLDRTPEALEKRIARSALPSGIKAAVLPYKARGDAVTLMLSLHYGNEESLKGNTLAVEVLGPMLTRGTKKHSRQELQDAMEKLKVRIQPRGGLGRVTLSVDCTRQTLPQALDLVQEILREPVFPAEEFDLLKRNARSGMERGRTEPNVLASQTLDRKLDPRDKDDLRYTPTIDETLERLDALTVEQLRKLYSDQLGGEHGEVAIVGSFDPEPTLKRVGEILKDWKATTTYKRLPAPKIADVKGEHIEIVTPDKANAFYMAGLNLALKDTDADHAALLIGNQILGGGLSSRLGQRVRGKEGLSYGIGSRYTAADRDDTGSFHIQAISAPQNAARVNTLVLEELEKLLKEGPTDDEVTAAKKAYVEQIKARRAGTTGLAGVLQRGLYLDRTLAHDAELEKKIAALTTEDVKAALKKHLDAKKLIIVQAGDFKK